MTVRVGSSLPEAHLLMVTYDEDGLVEYKWSKLNNQILSFDCSLDDKEAKNIQFLLLHDGNLHTAGFTLTRKAEVKALPMNLSVFRDKMEPGSMEKWTVTLPAGKAAEVLATMYDASLDQIVANNWSFQPTYRKEFGFPHWELFSSDYPGRFDLSGYLDPAERPVFKFDYLERVRFPNRDVIVEECAVMSLAAPMKEVANNGMHRKMKESDAETFAMNREVTGNASGLQVGEEPVKIRSNFAETAFFYPDLTPDDKGNVNFSFTMPESLTRWKFMALGHTPDLYAGSLVENVVTQKSFMVSPNYPRFLRHGDVCHLSAKVINLSDLPQKGTAQLQLLDPVSEKVLLERQCEFSLAAGQNGAVKWAVDVPRDADALLVRVTGRTGDFSDAEQKLLPVLSDRVVLTQSLPMAVRGGQTKTFTLENLKRNDSGTLASKFLKLEMATNPVWYAVQALPTVAAVKHENAISFSAAHFATKMAEYIAHSNPKIFKVIELWKQQSADAKTLVSNLEKNQDVKSVLLNETPWVMEAKNETERKQRLATLFEVNDLKSKSGTWLRKLSELQNPDGGFAWFAGMPSSWHTTLFVVDNYCRFKQVGIDHSDLDGMVAKAVRYLDASLAEDYEYCKKRSDCAYISPSQIYYFQLRGQLGGFRMADGMKKAFDFYFSLMEKGWSDFGLQTRASAAMAFHYYGKKSLAQKVVKSIREFSVTTEENGMHWPMNKSSYRWEDAAISTHTRLMEALALIDNKQQEQDELRIWLLNQKRTQDWESLIATVDALNVLLLNGSDWISKENVVSTKMGGVEVRPESAEVGTGYYSVTVPGKEVNPEMATVELSSEAGGNVSWGALYWQFEEDMEKVRNSEAGLQVEKMVMLETAEEGKVVLKTLNDRNKLRVGDKLTVRLTLRCDRDFEYVALKDQRASCLEPVQQLSGYRCSERVCYYQSPKDAAMYYFFGHLPKGTYVFEYPLYVTNSGDYSNGITTVQCLYAPEFAANTGSVRIHVE